MWRNLEGQQQASGSSWLATRLMVVGLEKEKKKRRETHNFPFPRCITAAAAAALIAATAAGSHSFCVLCRICSAP
jgi:hypothetical protein